MSSKQDILWTSADIAAATGGTASAVFTCSGVSIDTRTLKPGDLYVALLGERLDGHDYVEAAFKAGAAGALVRKGFVAASGPVVGVDDTMEALEALGRAARARAKGKIIAVTGSAGKTGTKEILASILGTFGKTHASKKSFNNHWGVPLTLANLPADAAYGVFELGMNHAGELTVLSKQVKPHGVIITTVEPVHIEHFNGVEGVADAKAEIFEGMEEGGFAVLPADNPHFLRLRGKAEKHGLKIIPFGEEESALARMDDCSLHADGSFVNARIMGEKVRYRINIPGRHIAMNALGALALVKAIGCPLPAAVEALRTASTVEGRGNRLSVVLETGKPPVTVIDESYNANPASMLAAFKVFEMVEPAEGGRRIAVLGDMLELGRDGPSLHASLANPLLKAKADMVFCCGAQMDALFQLLPPDWRGAHTKDSQMLAPLVAEAVRPGDVILVKGSAGSKMSYIVQALSQIKAKEPQQHAV